jgi:hypothetical protein
VVSRFALRAPELGNAAVADGARVNAGAREGDRDQPKEITMKTLVSALLALGLLAGTVAEANAVVCARGVYRAGCAGPHGAAVVRHPYGYGYHGGAAVVARPAYGAHCYWRAGVRVCR